MNDFGFIAPWFLATLIHFNTECVLFRLQILIPVLYCQCNYSMLYKPTEWGIIFSHFYSLSSAVFMYFIRELSQLWPDFGLPAHMPALSKAKRYLIFTERKPYPRRYVLKSDSNLISKNATQPGCISSVLLSVLNVYHIRPEIDKHEGEGAWQYCCLDKYACC